MKSRTLKQRLRRAARKNPGTRFIACGGMVSMVNGRMENVEADIGPAIIEPGKSIPEQIPELILVRAPSESEKHFDARVSAEIDRYLADPTGYVLPPQPESIWWIRREPIKPPPADFRRQPTSEQAPPHEFKIIDQGRAPMQRRGTELAEAIQEREFTTKTREELSRVLDQWSTLYGR